jgi:hypothetical protein
MKLVAVTLVTALSVLTFACAKGAAPGEPEPGAVAENTTAPAVSFVSAKDCSGIGGTWRGQVYSEPHGAYYEFTVQMAQSNAARPELSGSIVARSWAGTADDVSPPETCNGGFHWTVEENAAGELHSDGSVFFGATTWRAGESLCGDPVTDYSLDQLESLQPDGDATHVTKLTGVASDSAVWSDGVGIELTRIACQ